MEGEIEDEPEADAEMGGKLEDELEEVDETLTDGVGPHGMKTLAGGLYLS